MGEVSSSSPVFSAKLYYALFPDAMLIFSPAVCISWGLRLLGGAVLCSDKNSNLRKRELAELETYSSLFNFLTHRSRMMLTYWRFIKFKARTGN